MWGPPEAQVMHPLSPDEWESFKRLFDDAIRDVAERTEALRRWGDHPEGLASGEIPGNLRVAIREASHAVRLQEEDIVDRLSAPWVGQSTGSTPWASCDESYRLARGELITPSLALSPEPPMASHLGGASWTLNLS